MTTYQGGKKRIGRRIYQTILLIEKELGEFNMPYFEPFCGMCSVLRYFAANSERETYASDIHPDLILMWKAVQKGWTPPIKCSKQKYFKLKNSAPSPERAFIGFAASFNGNFFSSYRLNINKNIQRRTSASKTSRRKIKYKSRNKLQSGRNFLAESNKGVLDVKNDIKHTHFMGPSSYDKYNPENMLIYCDPPYKGNRLTSKQFQNFNHDKFWKTMTEWTMNKNIVIVSEWEAPNDWIPIWAVESQVNTFYRVNRYNEFLFIHKSIANKLSRKLLRQLSTESN